MLNKFKFLLADFQDLSLRNVIPPVTKTTSRQLLTLTQGMDPEVRTNNSQGTHRPPPDNSNRLPLPLSVGQSF